MSTADQEPVEVDLTQTAIIRRDYATTFEPRVLEVAVRAARARQRVGEALRIIEDAISLSSLLAGRGETGYSTASKPTGDGRA